MKLGVFTVSTPEYGIMETVKILKELGYDGVEWRVANPAPANKPDDYNYDRRYWSYNLSTLNLEKITETAAAIRNACEDSGLEIFSLTTYLEPSDIANIERVMKSAVGMNCKNMRVNVPKYDETENYRILFDRTVNQVKIIEKLAAEYRVRVNFEIHMGNIIPSASAAFRFISNFNPKLVGIIFDPGNMVYEGFENYRLGLELLGEYLACVHIKNAVWKLDETVENGLEVWKPSWAPLKKGCADLKKLIQVLKDLGYYGYLSVEDFSNEENTLSKLRNNLNFLKNMVNQ